MKTKSQSKSTNLNTELNTNLEYMDWKNVQSSTIQAIRSLKMQLIDAEMMLSRANEELEFLTPPQTTDNI